MDINKATVIVIFLGFISFYFEALFKKIALTQNIININNNFSQNLVRDYWLQN